MLIYLYGQDSYRRKQKLKAIAAAYRDKHKTGDVLIVDLKEAPDDWLKVKDFLNQPSIFASSKLAVVEEGTLVEDKNWVGAVKNQRDAEKTFLVISDAKRAPARFSFLLKNPVKHSGFEELSGGKLAAYLAQELSLRKLRLEQNAKAALSKYLESLKSDRSWVLANELDKISLAGFKQPVSVESLSLVLSWSEGGDVFQTARRILAARGALKLTLLEDLLLKKGEPAYLLNMLGVISSGGEILKLAECDVAVKSGKLDYETALTEFALS